MCKKQAAIVMAIITSVLLAMLFILPDISAAAARQITCAVNTNKLNIRSGPSRDYSTIGQLNSGDTFTASGRNANADWVYSALSVTKKGWLAIQFLGCSGSVRDLPVLVQRGETPTPIVLPTLRPFAPDSTPIVLPTVPPTPTPEGAPAPVQNVYFYPSTAVYCDDAADKTWFDGHVYVDGVPANGYVILFNSYITPGTPYEQISGPHVEHPDWEDGYYAHFVDIPRKSKVKHLQIWVADAYGQRVSDIAYWDTECAYAVIDFYGQY